MSNPNDIICSPGKMNDLCTLKKDTSKIPFFQGSNLTEIKADNAIGIGRVFIGTKNVNDLV